MIHYEICSECDTEYGVDIEVDEWETVKTVTCDECGTATDITITVEVC